MSCTFPKEGWKPVIDITLSTLSGNILDAVFVPNKDTVITSTDSLNLNIFQKRDSKYWESKTQTVPSNVYTLNISPSPSSELILFAGQENGTISHYVLTEDTNSMNHERDYLTHRSKVTGLAVDLSNDWLISVSEDKNLVISCLKTHKSLITLTLDAAATCLAYDASVRYCFVGDSQGTVTILEIKMESPNAIDIPIINTLRNHSAAITDLSWHATNSTLASSSKDNMVIIWDIGGGAGKAYDLHAHKAAVSTVGWWIKDSAVVSKNLGSNTNAALQRKGRDSESVAISAGLDGQIIFWLNSSERKPSTKWLESNTCQICGGAFMWNFMKMFENAALGSRQHHCRRCGKAVCQKCSTHTSELPYMGYEMPVRLCTECHKATTDAEKRPLAKMVHGADAITKLRVYELPPRMLIVGKSSTVRIMSLQ